MLRKPLNDAAKCHLPTSTGDTGLMIRNTILLYEDTEVPGGEMYLMEH